MRKQLTLTLLLLFVVIPSLYPRVYTMVRITDDSFVPQIDSTLSTNECIRLVSAISEYDSILKQFCSLEFEPWMEYPSGYKFLDQLYNIYFENEKDQQRFKESINSTFPGIFVDWTEEVHPPIYDSNESWESEDFEEEYSFEKHKSKQKRHSRSDRKSVPRKTFRKNRSLNLSY